MMILYFMKKASLIKLERLFLIDYIFFIHLLEDDKQQNVLHHSL